MVEAQEARVRASVVGSMLGKAAELVTLVLLATVVPRVLGPHDYGALSVPLTIVTLGSLALSLGGPTVLARFVPAAPVEDRVAVARAIGARLARGRAVQVVGLAVVALAAVVVDPTSFPPLRTALVVGALALSVLATLALQVPLGLGRTGPWAARYPLQNAVLVLLVLALRDVGDGTGPVLAVALSALVAAGFALVVLRPVLATPVAAPATVPEHAIRFGTYHAAGAALSQVAQRGAVVAIAVLGGSSAQVGFTALALGLALGITYAVLQAFTVSLPHLADAGRVAPGAGARTLGRLATALLVLLAPVLVLAAVLADRWVPTVFGAGYAGAASAFVPALALVALAPVSSLVVQLAALELRPRVAAAAGGAALVGWLAASVVLVPGGGAVRATSATLVGAVASATAGTYLLRPLVPPRLFAGSVAVAAAVVTGGVL